MTNDWTRNILLKSESIAASRFHTAVTPEHLLLGLLGDPAAVRSMRGVVNDAEMDIAALHNMLVKHIDRDMNLLVDRRSAEAPGVSSSVRDILRLGEERAFGLSLAAAFSSHAPEEQAAMLLAAGVLLEILHRDDTFAAAGLKAAGIRADDLVTYLESGPKIPANPKGRIPKPPRFV
ncbi:MAG: hypothetical protein IT560_13605 [Alphaproteobacteria bacterium]|nr:hypothetical protein [Alphaproteobacteria bacterium]